MAVLESAIKIEQGITVDLSEQWLINCNKDGWGCDGGWWAHDYHQWKKDDCGNTGAVLEDDCPYTARDDPCNCPYDHPFLIESWAFIGSEYGTPFIDSIKQAILDYGPVSVGVRAGSQWSFYTGGVYNSDDSGPVNHAVTLVGWDDNLGSEGCWILRNSWGSNWGDDGYMYIEYGCSSVGYSACYVDGYRGPPDEGEEVLTFSVKEITDDPERGDFEPIDPLFNKPEWYYRINADINGEIKSQRNYNIDPEGWWIFKWLSYYTWQPQEDHVFFTATPKVELTLKLMDDDLLSANDLADISAYPGGGEQDGADLEKRCAIYHGTYNLITDELSGDEVSSPDTEGIRTTIGDGDENAQVWFKITDSFNLEDYKPEIYVDPDLIEFSNVKIGENPTDSFNISNNGKEHNWAEDLTWSAEPDQDWITLEQNLGSVEAGFSSTVSIIINSEDLERDKTYSGKITIDSNDEPKIVNVKLTTAKNKFTKSIPNFFNVILNLIENFLRNYSLFY